MKKPSAGPVRLLVGELAHLRDGLVVVVLSVDREVAVAGTLRVRLALECLPQFSVLREKVLNPILAGLTSSSRPAPPPNPLD